MSVSANSAINPHVTINEVIGFLSSKYEIVEQRYHTNEYDSESCVINMKKTPSSKWISLLLSIDKTPLETRHDEDAVHINDEIIKEYLYVSSFGSHTQEHIELLKEMCELYGGALSDDDSDGYDFKWVNREDFFKPRLSLKQYLTEMLSPESMEIVLEGFKKFNLDIK